MVRRGEPAAERTTGRLSSSRRMQAGTAERPFRRQRQHEDCGRTFNLIVSVNVFENQRLMGKLRSALLAILFLTAIYEYGWPFPSLSYEGAVVAHLAAGVVLML